MTQQSKTRKKVTLPYTLTLREIEQLDLEQFSANRTAAGEYKITIAASEADAIKQRIATLRVARATVSV